MPKTKRCCCNHLRQWKRYLIIYSCSHNLLPLKTFDAFASNDITGLVFKWEIFRLWRWSAKSHGINSNKCALNSRIACKKTLYYSLYNICLYLRHQWFSFRLLVMSKDLNLVKHAWKLLTHKKIGMQVSVYRFLIKIDLVIRSALRKACVYGNCA
jgi:hypothetical protein